VAVSSVVPVASARHAVREDAQPLTHYSSKSSSTIAGASRVRRRENFDAVPSTAPAVLRPSRTSWFSTRRPVGAQPKAATTQ
jgi:hypothetical protein